VARDVPNSAYRTLGTAVLRSSSHRLLLVHSPQLTIRKMKSIGEYYNYSVLCLDFDRCFSCHFLLHLKGYITLLGQQ
jgi:hypothetical protein